jgi:hypothetical protein
MADTKTNPPPGIDGWPPPTAIPILPPPPRAFSMVFAAGAVVAGFLGYCMAAAILALLSLIFNLWDFYQRRGTGRPRGGATGGGSGTGYSGTGAQGSTPPATTSGGTDRPDRY